MYTTVLAFAATGFGLGLLLLYLGRQIGMPNRRVCAPYESGGNVKPKRWDRLNVRWLGYLPALLVLALVCGILFPLAAAAPSIGPGLAAGMAAFLLPVLIGVLYIWREGLLECP